MAGQGTCDTSDGWAHLPHAASHEAHDMLPTSRSKDAAHRRVIVWRASDIVLYIIQIN